MVFVNLNKKIPNNIPWCSLIGIFFAGSKNKEPNGSLSLPAQSFLRTASMGWGMSGFIAVSC